MIEPNRLYDKIISVDEKTVFRRKKLIYFIKDNNIKHQKCGQRYLIDEEDFIKTINPKMINKLYSIPRVRTIESAVREFNATHIKQINHHIAKKCILENKNISLIKGVRLHLLNYDEFEKEIILMNKRKRNW